MNPFIIRWKPSLAHYFWTVGWAGVGYIFALMLTPITPIVLVHGPLPSVLWCLAGCVTAALYLQYLRRLQAERFFTLSKEGVQYQKFKGDVHSMRWDEITNVEFNFGRSRLGHPNALSGYLMFKSSADSFKSGGLCNIRDDEGLLGILRIKLKERFVATQGGLPGIVPQTYRTISNVLQSWDDFDLAEPPLREALPMAEVMDKKHFQSYLDEYAAVLRKLGRSEEADEVETRSPERIKELCKRMSFLDL